MEVTIRPGRKSDLPRVLELIKELAEFERAPDEVTNTLAMMENDGFGPNPSMGSSWPRDADRIVGLSLFIGDTLHGKVKDFGWKILL